MNQLKVIPDRASMILFLFMVLFSLLLLEIGMRYYIFGTHAFSYSQMKSVRDFGVSGMVKASEHQEILWELQPDLNTTNKLVPFRTNHKGLRDQEYPLEKKDQSLRIAVLGDSFTMPEGVPIEDAWHSVLERRLKEEYPELNSEVINFGVAGYSLIQYRATIEKKALQFQPDAILIGFCGANDSAPPEMKNFKPPYKVKATKNGFFHMYSFELIGDVYKRYYKKFKGRYAGYDANEEYVESEFEKIALIAKKQRTPIVIAYIDNKQPSADFTMVESAAKRHGFYFLNGAQYFEKDINPEHIIYKTDRHPNAKANEIIAKALFEDLKHQGIIEHLVDIKDSKSLQNQVNVPLHNSDSDAAGH